MTTLIPLVFGGAGLTASLSIEKNAALPPGLHLCPAMLPLIFPVAPDGPGFIATVNLAYQVAMNFFALPAGSSLVWCVRPCRNGMLPGLSGGSAGAAFLLAFMKKRFEDLDMRPLKAHGELEQATAAVRLEWVAASAGIFMISPALGMRPSFM